MIPAAVANMITDALCGLARANWTEFSSDQSLCQSFYANLKGKKHRYISDKATCGFADCWSSYRALVGRYQKKHDRFCKCADPICANKRRLVAKYPGVILLDCEDAACSLSGWLQSQCYTKDRILVGLVPGNKVSHAVSGVLKPDNSIHVLDPARWYGMSETTYENPYWRDVATGKAPDLSASSPYRQKDLT